MRTGRPARSGLDRLADGERAVVQLVRGKRVGLVAHPASVTSSFVHARTVLERAGADVVALFGPEHGYGGEAQDMVAVANQPKVVTGTQSLRPGRAPVPVHSLYGATFDELSPRREWLEDLDALVIDLQDVGSRYYTFVWTAALATRAASQLGVQTIILDRVNPLGDALEGAPQRPGYQSFVGLYDVAVRHGMSIGEIMAMVSVLERIPPEALCIVGALGVDPHALWPLGAPWVPPSPNMPTFDTALVYPGGCLLEGTQLSEGRGTTRPFEIVGGPRIDAVRVARETPAPGCVLRPLTFQPTFQKHAGRLCVGLQVHVTDAVAFRPYATYLRLIASIARISPEAFAWRTTEYEFVRDRPAIDLLTGGPEFREAVIDGSVEDVIADDARALAPFAEYRADFRLYGERPGLVATRLAV